jgi:hypothetical protein
LNTAALPIFRAFECRESADLRISLSANGRAARLSLRMNTLPCSFVERSLHGFSISDLARPKHLRFSPHYLLLPACAFLLAKARELFACAEQKAQRFS